MSEQVAQEFATLLKAGGNNANLSYFEIAQSLTLKKIDIRKSMRSILKENLTTRLKKEASLYKCFGEPLMDDYDGGGGVYRLCFHFAAGEKDHYKIDLIEDGYGRNWSIEIAPLKDADNFDNIDEISKIMPHPQKNIFRFSNTRTCMGTQNGWGGGVYFPYIGAEDAYHDTVIQVLRAFHTRYNGDIKVAP